MKGVRLAMRELLRLKFGAEGEALLAQLPQETEASRLLELNARVGVALSLDQVRPLFVPDPA